MDYTYSDVAKMIDHSLLNPTLTRDDLEAGCGWRSLTVLQRVHRAVLPEALRGIAARQQREGQHDHRFSAWVNTTAIKAAEARQAIADGARNWTWLPTSARF